MRVLVRSKSTGKAHWVAGSSRVSWAGPRPGASPPLLRLSVSLEQLHPGGSALNPTILSRCGGGWRVGLGKPGERLGQPGESGPPLVGLGKGEETFACPPGLCQV